MIEAPLDGRILSFDGRMFEVHSPYKEGTSRYHARLMVDCVLDRDMLTVTWQRNDTGFWAVRPTERPQVQALVDAIDEARAAWREG